MNNLLIEILVYGRNIHPENRQLGVKFKKSKNGQDYGMIDSVIILSKYS